MRKTVIYTQIQLHSSVLVPFLLLKGQGLVHLFVDGPNIGRDIGIPLCEL
jgi:hypothetical protein